MKKALMLAAAIALLAAPVFADDAAPTLGGLHAASGSVSFSFGDSDISDNDGFGFTSTSAGTTASSVTASIATEKVEAGATIALIPTINKVDGTSDNSGSALSTNIEYAKDALAWYLDNITDDDWDMSGSALTPADFETYIDGVTTLDTLYDVDAAGDGSWDGDYVIETEAVWEEVQTVAGGVIALIINELETELAATILADDNFVDQDANLLNGTLTASAGKDYDYTSMDLDLDQFGQVIEKDSETVVADTGAYTQAQLDALAAEGDAIEAAYDSYFDAVFENSSDDSWVADFPVSNAYLRLLAVGGVVDVEFELNGKKVSTGSKYTLAGDDANVGMGVALTEGVIEGLSVDVLYTILAGKNGDSEDWETLAIEESSNSEPVHGIDFHLGYTTDLFFAKAGFAIEDIAKLKNSDGGRFWYTVQGGLTMADVMGLAVTAELTGGVGSGNDATIGVAADAKATILGITPSVDFRLTKGLHGSADTDDETTALSYFQTADEDNTFLGIGLAVDLAELMGMTLVTVDGSFGIIFGGEYDFMAGLGLDFTELFAPVTVGFDIGQTYDANLTWGLDASATFAGITATANLDSDESEANLGWGFGLGYTYDILEIAAGFTSDYDAVRGFDITVKTSF